MEIFNNILLFLGTIYVALAYGVFFLFIALCFIGPYINWGDKED